MAYVEWRLGAGMQVTLETNGVQVFLTLEIKATQLGCYHKVANARLCA